MKGIVWLVLASFGFALGQTAVVEPLVRHSCTACNCRGRCGMPDCAPPAPRAPDTFLSELRSPAAQPARVTARAGRSPVVVFTIRCPRSAPVARRARADVPRVRLFEAHCAFLI